MSAMDTESDQVAVDHDVRLGKRKRSPRGAPEDEQHTATEDRDGPSRLTSQEKDTQPILKRSRPEHDTSVREGLGHLSTNADTVRTSLLQLPVRVLQRILSLVDPFSLARIMCVNRFLYQLLGYRQDGLATSGLTPGSPVLTSNSIWAHSRMLYDANLPHPLQPLSELEMLKLLFGKRCQTCGRLPREPSYKLSETQWNAGPGLDGVRAIWPLKSRLCAECLRPLLLKEPDLIEREYQHLEKGLAPISLTKTLNYVMSATLQRTPLPHNLQLTNYYLRPQLHDLLGRAAESRALGNAAYRSWLDNLDVIKQEHMAEVFRVEEWERLRKFSSEPAVSRFRSGGRSSASESGIPSDLYARTTTSLSGFYRPRTALSDVNGGSSFRASGPPLDPRPGMEPPVFTPGPGQPPPQHPLPSAPLPATRFSTTHQSDEASGPRVQPPQDISALKAQKRIDIQRRCMFLDPPILPDMLKRLPAFLAAIETLLPLDNDSWEVLKARLLRQRESEEVLSAAEYDVASHTDSLDAPTAFRFATPPDESVEEDLRKRALRKTHEKLSDFARDFVRQRPAHGTNLTHGSAPQFAADVLLYVRRRFYEEQAREDAAYAIHGEPPPDEGPSGARARRLRLEHMKHVFDTSIKPLTEFVRKDLFLCSACDTQGRHFAFEAIIQHFASKHTDTFSRGTAVVYWKSEWPDEPPFHPAPGKDIGWNRDPSFHPATTSYPQFQATPSETSRIVSTASGSGDRQTARPDTSIRPHSDVEYRRPHAHYVPWPIDTHTTSRPDYMSRYRTSTQLADRSSWPTDQERGYGSGSYQLSRPVEPSYHRHILENDPQRPLHRSSVETLGPVEVGHHDTLFLPQSQSSRWAPHSNERIQNFSEPFRRHRDPPVPASADPSLSSTTHQRGHLEQRDPVRSHDAAGVSEPRHQDDLDTRTGQSQSYDVHRIPAQRGVASVSAFDRDINTVETFLDNFNPVVANTYEKDLSRDQSVSRLATLERSDVDRRGAFMDRRSNISQPLKRGRTASDDGIYRQMPEPAASNDAIQNQRDRDDQVFAPSYYATDRRETGLSASATAGSFQSSEGRILSPAATHLRAYENQIFSRGEYETYRNPYSSMRHRYVDRNGRYLSLASAEMRVPEAVQYRELRFHPYEEPRMFEQRYELSPYERREPTRSPEARRYIFQRQTQGYDPGARYVQIEEDVPSRIVTREEDDRRYVRQPSTHHPSTHDPRFERRQQ